MRRYETMTRRRAEPWTQTCGSPTMLQAESGGYPFPLPPSRYARAGEGWALEARSAVVKESLASLRNQGVPTPDNVDTACAGARLSASVALLCALGGCLEQDPRSGLNRTAVSYELARLCKVDPGARQDH